jgi:hypothetical protein
MVSFYRKCGKLTEREKREGIGVWLTRTLPKDGEKGKDGKAAICLFWAVRKEREKEDGKVAVYERCALRTRGEKSEGKTAESKRGLLKYGEKKEVKGDVYSPDGTLEYETAWLSRSFVSGATQMVFQISRRATWWTMSASLSIMSFEKSRLYPSYQSIMSLTRSKARRRCGCRGRRCSCSGAAAGRTWCT